MRRRTVVASSRSRVFLLVPREFRVRTSMSGVSKLITDDRLGVSIGSYNRSARLLFAIGNLVAFRYFGIRSSRSVSRNGPLVLSRRSTNASRASSKVEKHRDDAEWPSRGIGARASQVTSFPPYFLPGLYFSAEFSYRPPPSSRFGARRGREVTRDVYYGRRRGAGDGKNPRRKVHAGRRPKIFAAP